MATKIPFKTAYSERSREYFSPTGDGIEPIYEYEINKYGQKVLVKTGEYSLYDKIQESLEETKIENILAKVANGDSSMMRPNGMYVDLTQVPGNLIEARQQMQKLENVWNSLDTEVKRKYDFDVEKFIGASGTEAWLLDMGLIEKKPDDMPFAEPKESEGSAE